MMLRPPDVASLQRSGAATGASTVLIRVDRASSRHTRHPRHLHPALDLEWIRAGIVARGTGTVTLLDGWLEPFAACRMADRALAHRPQIAIIRAVTWCLDESIAVATRLREAGVITIAIGQQVQHIARSPAPGWKAAYDLAIKGEAEEAAVGLVEQLLAGVPVASLRKRWPVAGDGRLTLVEFPDALPRRDPASLALDAYPFPFPVRGHSPRRWAYVLTAWGCPRPCRHCTSIVRKSVGDRLRPRAVASVLDEIAGLIDAGADGLALEDDSLFVHKSRFIDLADGMLRRGLRLPWMANARPDELDDERIAAAAAAGAVLLKVGVDSGAPRLVEAIGKAADGREWIEASRRAFAGIDAAGIGSVLLLMLGLPNETGAEAEATARLALELPADYLQIQRYQPYPDVAEWSPAAAADYHYASGAIAPGTLPAAALDALQRRAYRQFYLRPGFIARHLRRHWRHYLGRGRATSPLAALDFVLRPG